MATIKNYTDLNQSKKLAEILPLESADGGWYGTTNPFAANTHFWLGTKYSKSASLPTWSLAALLGVLPLVDLTTPQLIGTPKTLYRCIYNDNLKSHADDNPVDACVDMIERLHKLKML